MASSCPTSTRPTSSTPIAAPGVRYSFTGAIQQPRQVLRGGYLSWLDVTSNTWWQETWFSGNKPSFRSLGRLSAENGSLRSQIDRLTVRETAQAVSGGIRAAKAAGLPLTAVNEAAEERASSLRRQIQALIGEGISRQEEEHEPSLAGAEAIASAGEWRSARGRRSSAGRRRNGPEAGGLRMAPSVWTGWSGAGH